MLYMFNLTYPLIAAILARKHHNWSMTAKLKKKKEKRCLMIYILSLSVFLIGKYIIIQSKWISCSLFSIHLKRRWFAPHENDTQWYIIFKRCLWNSDCLDDRLYWIWKMENAHKNFTPGVILNYVKLYVFPHGDNLVEHLVCCLDFRDD